MQADGNAAGDGRIQPEAIRLWQQKMAGTGLEMVAAGGMGGSSESTAMRPVTAGPRAQAIASVEPGSAVSAQLVRGDLEIAATCTVTYIDPKQLLACGHPLLQAGPVSLPMTTAEVVATLASPLNAFKIVNTGEPIGAFTEDRDSAIRGVLGARGPHDSRAHPHSWPQRLAASSTWRFSTCPRSRHRPCLVRLRERCLKPTKAPRRPATTSPGASTWTASPLAAGRVGASR